ncbi:hypothetical protein [Nostoc sp. FACHB-888]|uniref:hypothetical protein n=1 Tax=Nostoc sp. FACHB-888 TaxID=2692842 RepID=UPI0016894564|nr:hypothetical protein [Nostoc sp. FACHB-888]MBD2246481.1 hypothetical protein [Nostoc sp. FACHB-888]
MSNDPNKSSGKSYSTGNFTNVPGIVNIGEGITNTLRDIRTTIDKLPKDESEDSEIKKALNELEEAIVSDPNLPVKRKEEALQKLKDLAAAANNPNPKAEESRKDANYTITLLKSMTDALGNATQFAEIFNKVLPAIKLWFGLP